MQTYFSQSEELDIIYFGGRGETQSPQDQENILDVDRAQNSMELDRCEYKLTLGILPWVTQASQLPSLSRAPGLYAGDYHTYSGGGFGEKSVSAPRTAVSDYRPGSVTQITGCYPKCRVSHQPHVLQLQAD